MPRQDAKSLAYRMSLRNDLKDLSTSMHLEASKLYAQAEQLNKRR